MIRNDVFEWFIQKIKNEIESKKNNRYSGIFIIDLKFKSL